MLFRCQPISLVGSGTKARHANGGQRGIPEGTDGRVEMLSYSNNDRFEDLLLPIMLC